MVLSWANSPPFAKSRLHYDVLQSRGLKAAGAQAMLLR